MPASLMSAMEAVQESDPCAGPSAGAATRLGQAGPGCSLVLDGGAIGLRRVRLSVAKVRALEAGGDATQPVLCAEVTGAGSDASGPREPVDVVLVIDVSGSMHGVIGQLQQTVQQVFEELQGADRIGVVIFSSWAQVLQPLTRKDAVSNFSRVCRKIAVGGATHMESGLRKGFELLGAGPGAGEQPSRALMLLLSDGAPNQGRTSVPALRDLVGELAGACERRLTLHSLGFTEYHCIDLMSALPQESRGDVGNYYYLGSDKDIQASVGDCLGSLMPAVCSQLELKVLPAPAPAEDGEEGKDEARCWYYGHSMPEAAAEAPVLGLQPQQHTQHEGLRAGERQAFLFALTPRATRATLHAIWTCEAGEHAVSLQLDWAPAAAQPETVDLDEGSMPCQLSTLRVIAHVLRLQVGVALAALAVGDVTAGRYEHLHGMVLSCLQALHSAPTAAGEGPDAIFLEGVLQALERDLGEALAQSRGGMERTGLLLSFAKEHLQMRSASSLTRCRAAYSSRAQVESRLRFLQSSGSAGGEEARQQCPLVEPGLSEEELECRRRLEEGALALEEDGFVVPGAWREGVLGLGLFVHPRKLADRRKGLPPEIDLAAEYVSAEAYNLGVRAAIQHVAFETAGEEELDEPSGEGPSQQGVARAAPVQPAAVSRQRINGWLPVYLNRAHWEVARTFAPSAFSLLATQLNAAFRPSDALQVCTRLMCCAVVGFVHPGRDAEPERKRAPASDRAVQMYCDVHRLFHEMARAYPEIRVTALDHVRGFMGSPERRTRKSTPSLGDLIAYLTILDEVSWEDLAPVFVPEMVRRAFARFSEPFCPESCLTMEGLIQRFDALEPEHGRVILFNLVFNRLVARPSEPWSAAVGQAGQAAEEQAVLSGEEVCEMYDRRWGQLPLARCRAVADEVRRIGCLGSVSMVLRELLPFPFSDDDVAKLLLWGAKHGRSHKAIPDVPDLRSMPQSLTAEWALRIRLRGSLLQGLERNLARGLPSRECFQELLHACERSEEDYAVALKEMAAEDAEAQRQKSADASRVSLADESYQPGEAKLPPEEWKAVKKLARHRRDPFDLEVVCPEDGHGGSSFTLAGTTYGSPDKLSTGWDLRVAIAAKTGTDPRKMRLLLHGAARLTVSPAWSWMWGHAAGAADAVAEEAVEGSGEGSGGEEDQLVALSNSAPLALWQLGERPVTVEVRAKHRGGKKLGRPGNGWHKQRNKGSTYAMGIAGTIVRETAFAGVKQYSTIVNGDACFQALLGLARMFDTPTVVLCSSGTAAALRHELQSTRSGVNLVLVEEVEQCSDSAGENDAEEAPAVQPKDVIVECDVEVPEEAVGAKLIVTYGSPLRETASLAKVVRSVRSSREAEVTVFHLVADHRPVLLRTQADVDMLVAALGEDGRHLHKELLLPGAQPLPSGAALMCPADKDALLAPPSTLPRIVKLRLNSFGLGFVVRLRQRFQIAVADVMLEALQKVLDSAPAEQAALPDDEWVAL